jgi:hypothetical protein
MPAGARRRLGCVWLVWQLTVTLAAPVAVWATTDHTDQAECECGHGSRAMCPMHKNKGSQPSGCVLRSTDTDVASAALSFLSATAPEPTATRVVFMRVRQLPPIFTSAPIERPVTPDLPPPRT